MYNELKKNSLLVTMGNFDSLGGWGLDTQFIPNMGFPYLLAHGLGNPVEDATTKVVFPKAGDYKMWVYTYNWVSPWKPEYAPGRFQVMTNGISSEIEFGTEPTQWGWQEGEVVHIEDVQGTVTLHDLTGFEGRCGLVFYTQEEGFVPPVLLTELRDFADVLLGHTKEVVAEEYDMIVVGAGIAGICCALSSARNGIKTALVQDRGVVGGCNSSEVRVWLGGETNFAPFSNVGNIVKELEQERKGHYGSENIGEIYEDDRKLQLLKDEENLTLYMYHAFMSCETKDDKIENITVYDVKNDIYIVLSSKLYTDCSGDGILGYESGADYEITTNGHMGMTNMWYVEDTGEKQSFEKCPWAIDLSAVEFPGRGHVKDVYNKQYEYSMGCWFWESGMEHDPIEKAEYARDTNFRAMYGAWNTLKNHDNAYPTYKLGYCSYIAGKRESRRLLGDLVLTKSDVHKNEMLSDVCVPSTWNFDVHYPDRRFYSAFHEGDGFLTKDYHEKFNKPYFIPYRCFYSRNVNNLFMAGRNVSVSHDALGTARVMRTGGMIGEVIGVAASICRKYNVLPRDIYTTYLDEFIGTIKD